MVAPSRMRGRRPIKIPVHSVMDVLGAIDKLGHSKKFRAAAKKSRAFMTLHPKTVNFVKDYMAKNNLHAKSAVASKVVGGCPGSDPYNCPYEQK
jgi:hypothetical protein